MQIIFNHKEMDFHATQEAVGEDDNESRHMVYIYELDFDFEK